MSTENSTASLLVLILEIDSLISFIKTKNLEAINNLISNVVSSIILFCKSYTLMHRQNRLAVIASMSNCMEVIYPEKSADFVPSHYSLSEQLAVKLLDANKKQLEIYSEMITDTELKGSFSQSLSTALSIINRQSQVNELQSRILVLQFEKDGNQDYNSLMNSIFSGQKLNVLIDALILSSFDSHIMQQACFLTGGLYIKHSDINDCLQLLHTYFLADNATRTHLTFPLQKSVDFKASCHCHKRPVEFAYMCSVCLTLTCQTSNYCEVCSTEARVLNKL